MDIPFGLVFSLVCLILYHRLVSTFGLPNHARLLSLSLNWRGNLALSSYQLRAVPSICAQLWRTSSSLDYFTFRLGCSILFLFPRMITYHPLYCALMSGSVYFSLYVYDYFLYQYLFVPLLMEVVTGVVVINIFESEEDEDFIGFIGGPKTLAFYKEDEIDTFFK